jgi:predicted outer membrane protein
MKSRVRKVQWGLATITMLSVAAVAFAQQRQQTQPQQPGNVQQQGQQRVTVNRLNTEGGAAQNTDHTIANWLATMNEAEIEINKTAASKTEDKDVREFAEKMVKEHGQLQQQLERFGAQPVRLAGRGDRRETRTGAVQQGQPAQPQARDGQGQPARQETRAPQGQTAQGQGAGRPFHFLEVQREIAERCVAAADKELGEKKGSHRDEAFIGMQIAAHQGMIDTAEVLREYASPELRSVIDKSIESAQSHMDHAKKLIHNLVNEEKRDDKSNKDNK